MSDRILRLQHVEVRVPDLELCTAYYTEVVGLIEAGAFVRFGEVFEAFMPARLWRGERATLDPLGVSMVARSGRRLRCALPYGPVVKLNDHAIRRVDRAEIGPCDPDAPRVVHPGAGRLAGLVDHVEFPAVLGDEGEVARADGHAALNALIGAGQIHALRRRLGCDQRCRHGNRT